MLDLSIFLIFVGSTLVILIIPGPATIYIMTRSMDQGRAAGVVSAMGISVGTFIYVITAAFGLSAILLTSAMAFSFVKYTGAIYLIYLGIRELVGKVKIKDEHFSQKNVNLRRIFYEGVLVNLLNPKLSLFMFAFLPQFINLSNGPVPIQILTLGIILIALGLCTDTMYALLSSKVSGWIKRNQSFMVKQKYFTGTIYIVLGMITALAGDK